MSVFLEDKVLEYGETKPNRLAVGFKDEQITYKALRGKILRICSFLSRQGIGRGSIVLLQAVTGSDYVAAYLALHCLGAVAVPIDRKAAVETIRDIQKQLETSFFIGSDKSAALLNGGIRYSDCMEEKEIFHYVPLVYEAGDIYDILYTTGTTGQAKGVMATRGSVLAAIQNEMEGPEMTSEEVLLIPIPLNHSFGIGKMRAVLYLGGTVVLQNGVSMAAELKNNIEKFHCTAMICVPSALNIISRQAGERLGEILGNLHFIEAASAPFGIDLKEKLLEQLPDVHILNRFGSTETPAAIYLDMKETPDKLASIGKAVSGARVKIVDEERKEIISSKENIGKLAISGAMLMKGYYRAEELTKSVLQDGWLYSKDMAYIDQDGYIFLMGRDDDVINTGGKKFSPLEVEDLLMKSELIRECAIVGIPDPKKMLGMVPVMAYVPSREGIGESAVMKYLRERIEKYKIPVKCMRVKLLPRNYMGKLERNKVKELFTMDGAGQ